LTPISSAWREGRIKAYITGICGFAGSWLAEELLAHGYRVRGAALPGESDDNLAHISRRITVDRFDITDPDACKSILTGARPDYLFHLAAVSSVGQSFSIGELTFRVNVIGSYNIFEALRGKDRLKKILYTSSSDVYGPIKPKDMPLKPNRPFNPVSPYAQSKAAAEYLARIYIEQYEMPMVIARSFNHTGPRQNPDFAVPAFCRKIAAVEQSRSKEAITVGNLSARRDISDVRDIVRGYRLLAEKGSAGQVYHLCSGKAYRIGDLLKKLTGFTDTPIRKSRDPELYRKVEIPVLQGSYYKTRRDIGWKPEISIDRTLKDTLDYWRDKG
jgi:GDP-4-dehydro-6-deoxy-D-mannose reductase